jgi:hypothetical protein
MKPSQSRHTMDSRYFFLRRGSMSIQYVCRYCGHHIGQLDQSVLTEEHLGFNTLTYEERESMITYKENGDIQANVICEHCQEAVKRNPELLLQQGILQ